MAKQALAWPKERLTKTQFILNYPQRSLVKNEFEEIEGGVPCLMSCIVGIATAAGYNQASMCVCVFKDLRSALCTKHCLNLKNHNSDVSTMCSRWRSRR